MAAVELSLLGVALSSLAGDVAKGLIGNATQDVVKVGVRSLLDRIQNGELAANHDVMRACRRANLLATHFAARQFVASRRDQAGSTWEIEWAECLAKSRFEEMAHTKEPGYCPPPSCLGQTLEELMKLVEGSSDAAGVLQAQAIEELLGEIDAWHQRECSARGWPEPYPPSAFEGYLRSGWPYVEPEKAAVERVAAVFKKRRGHYARGVEQAQRALAPTVSGTITWFGAFAAFFAEELKSDSRVQAIVNARLLSQVNERLHAAGAAGVSAAELEGKLTDGLMRWSQHVCEHADRLHALVMRAIAEHSDGLLAELAAARDRSSRNALLLREIKAGIDTVQTQQVQSLELLRGLAAGQAQLLAQIAADKGVPVAPLRAILARLGELDVPLELIADKLAAAADDFLAMRARWQAMAIPEVADVRGEAISLLERGDLAGARALLQDLRGLIRARREESAREEATLLGEEAKLDRLELCFREAAAKYAQAAELVRFDAKASIEYALDRAGVLAQLGDELGDNAALDDAIASYRGLLSQRASDVAPYGWAVVQNELGNALATRGERSGDIRDLESASEAFRSALQEITRERAPLQWASIQNNLGTVLMRVEDPTRARARLTQAIEAFESALLVRTRSRAPLQWALTHINLGVLHRTLGELEPGTAHLERSVEVLEAALEEFTRERTPREWAKAHSNLGLTLTTLGERETSTANLERAAAAYRAALLEYKRERLPLLWARAQNSLGWALFRLGERLGDPARLQQAIEAHEAALSEYERERAPIDWAATQVNLGNAFGRLAAYEGAAHFERAVAAYRLALEEFTRERAPFYWSQLQCNLGHLLWKWAEHETGPARLEEAISAYHLALEECPREGSPLQWAIVQNNLGNALLSLGKRESGTERLIAAHDVFQAALQERTRSRVPLDWAMTQNSLGVVLRELATRSAGAEHLGRSVEAFRAALQECTAEVAPLFWAMMQRNLGTALRMLGGRDNNAAALEQAIEAFRAAGAEFEHRGLSPEWTATQSYLADTLRELSALKGSPA